MILSCKPPIIPPLGNSIVVSYMLRGFPDFSKVKVYSKIMRNFKVELPIISLSVIPNHK